MSYNIKQQIRTDTPQVGYAPYRQVHAHSTGNSGSTAQNEADYMSRKDLNTGFYTHVVGNGQVIQVAPVNRGAWDVGGGYNYETYAAVELIESHGSKDEFMRDYKIYCELLYDLAKEAGIPTTLDTGDLAGIKTHNYCTHNQPNNGSDHVDPIPYLTKWGITQQQFANDIVNCKGNNNSENNSGSNPQLQKGEIEMYLIYTIDTKNWYVSNGVECKWVKTDRMLKNYQNEFGKLNLRVDKMYSTELYKEFPKNTIIK
ncbi:peptidoglycan recognition protein family protein [Lactococcus garvieae]|uniref:peptidoglycan recognition protein family protein n=1 Tax=Lactococcus garvieae TaxID=1363 RepID=UPI001BCEB1E8|nr:peptidoglycan recognition protein [Lactococcus garvieae]